MGAVDESPCARLYKADVIAIVIDTMGSSIANSIILAKAGNDTSGDPKQGDVFLHAHGERNMPKYS